MLLYADRAFAHMVAYVRNSKKIRLLAYVL